MDRHTFTRTVAGLGIIIIGVLALLGGFNILDFGSIFNTWWPLVIVGAGLLMLVNNPREFVWPVLVIFAGVLFQLKEFNLLNFNIWHLFWPTVLISIGISVLTNKSARPTKTNEASDAISALLSGNVTKNQSQDYIGGSISAILGGATLDLREAQIKKEATIHVFALMGGVEIRVPEDWEVQSKVTAILGGAEIKTSEKIVKNAPKLIIVGDVIMGGVEIKH